ncbi:MAG: hypothetical protein WC332_01580 [Clostridia bacterium]
MDKTILEKRIAEKANRSFSDQMTRTIKLLQSDPILSRLMIYKDKEKKEMFELCGTGGYCPGTTLFRTDESLLLASTNFEKIKALLIEEYEKNETDKMLKIVGDIADFIERREDER